MANLFQQLLGVRGYDLSTRRANSVIPANFGIGGIMAQFQRKYAKAFYVDSPTRFRQIFGSYFSSSAYGPDTIDDFFNNLAGQQGALYVGSYVGNNSGVIDAIVAQANAKDTEGIPADVLLIEAAYQGEPQYGVDGGNTGYTITAGNRFSTTVTAGGISPQTVLALASVAGIEVGDIVKVTWTGGTPGSGGFTVQSIDYTLRQITLNANLGTGNFVNIGDVVVVPGFQIHTWRKQSNGVAVEVDTDRAQQWCTTVPAVSDHYVGNIFASSNYISVSALAVTPTDPSQGLPAAVSSVVYLSGGADGTQPTGTGQAAAWNNTLQLFNNLPVRFLGNPETSDQQAQAAGESYCLGRWDTPFWIGTISPNQSMAQLVVTGNGFQRSGKVLMVNWGTWGYKVDPYQQSQLAPYRGVPPVGAQMGYWIRIIQKYGIHYVPSIPSEPIIGWQDIYGFQALDDGDRTTLANAGINVIQNIAGQGIVPRNSVTPSTTVDYVFPNAALMASFIKVSGQASLISTENLPLTYAKIQGDRSSLDMFMRSLWDFGSTGNVPTGETFAQTMQQAPDGSIIPSKYEDSVSVEANLANNPQSQINVGNSQIWVYFMRPAPNGSIRIGVGIQLAG